MRGGITASSVIAAILSLSDRMSPKLINCGKAWDQLSNKEKAAAKSAMASMDKMQKKASSMISSVLKLGSAIAVSAVGLGFSEALSLEKYRTQLETATKDTERASEVMRYAVNLANSTPFEGGDMVAASAALEMASLSTETYLTTLGDTAAGVNRSISEVQTQFIKAFSTGQTGEFFDSINVSRKSFEDFAKANKLSTASIEDTQIALKRFLDEKFGGGMANLAKTTSGAWSTITGVTKSALAQMVGMGTDGTVRIGSALDMLREKAQYFSGKLVEWQENGQLDKYAREIGSALSTVWDIGEKVFTTLWKYRDLVAGIAAVGASIWAAQKAMMAYKTVTEVARVATILFNGAISLNPIMILIAGIGLAIMQTKSFKELFEELPNILDGTSEKFDNLGSAIGNALGNVIIDLLRGAYNTVAWILNLLNPFSDSAIPVIAEDDEMVRVPWNSGAGAAYYQIGDSSGWEPYANGTQYHTGGLALVGERGPELIRLPSGSRVMTAERTRKFGGSTTVNNYITISGANRSNEEIADMVAKRIVEEVENAW